MTRTVATDLGAVDAATTWRDLRAAAQAIWEWPVDSAERKRLCDHVAEKKETWSRRRSRVQVHRRSMEQAVRRGRTNLPMEPPRSIPPPKIGSAREVLNTAIPLPPPPPPPPPAPPPPAAVRIDVSPAEAIKRAVASYFGVSARRLEGDQRDAPVVRARHVAMFLMHEELLMSTVAIGKAMGRDHTTVLHGLDRVRNAPLRDGAMATAVSTLRSWWQEEVGRVAQAV